MKRSGSRLPRFLGVTVVLLGLGLWLGLFSLPVAAEEAEISEFFEQLPDAVRAYFPAQFDTETLLQMDVPFFGRLVGATFGALWGDALRLFRVLLTLILLAALLKTAAENGFLAVGSVELAEGCSVAFAAFFTLSPLQTLFSMLIELLESLRGFLAGILPVSEGILLAGGSVGQAGVTATTLTLSCATLDTVAQTLLLPLFRICFCMLLLSALSAQFTLAPVSDFVGSAVVFLCALYMAILLGVFSFQSTVAAAGDGAAMRALRFSAGNLLPVVGGAVSEAMKTVTGSLGLLRSLIGGGAVAAILLLSIPLLLRFLLYRTVFRAVGAAAGVVKCSRLRGFFEGCVKLTGYLIALLSMFSVSAIFQMSVFAKMTFGMGGV